MPVLWIKIGHPDRIRAAKCGAAQSRSVFTGGRKGDQRRPTVLRLALSRDQSRVFQLVEKRNHSRLLHGRMAHQVALQHRTFPIEKQDRADQRERETMRSQGAIDGAIEYPCGVIRQITGRHGRFGMYVFVHVHQTMMMA